MFELDNEPFFWPEPVETGSMREEAKLVRLSGLPESRKKTAWLEINQNAPGLATLLKSQSLREIQTAFDAELFVDASIVPSLPPERLKGRN
jgi:hypothetical protein